MGQLHFNVNGKTYTRNIKYVTFQDRDGLMTRPIECQFDIILSTGKKEDSNERILEFIENPASIRRRNPKDLFPAQVDPFFTFLAGMALMFTLMIGRALF